MNAVLGQHCVEGRERILLRVGNLGIVFRYDFRMVPGSVAQAIDNDSIAKLCLGQLLGIELVVDDKV